MSTAPTPLVSVVIPTYNRAAMVGAAIDSVLTQSFRDVEIIVVDDGSTDDTADRVRQFGDRVRYVKTENGGSAHARNVGMRLARGRYLTFLDSDDLHYPYTLELQVNLLERFPEAAFLYCEMSGLDERGVFERYHMRRYHHSAYRSIPSFDALFGKSVPLGSTGPLPTSLLAADDAAPARRVYFGNIFDEYLVRLVLFTNSVMMRRETIARVGERNEAVRYWEEMDYTLRMSRHHTVAFIDVPTYQLRYHDDQISTQARADGRYIWIRKQQILLRVVTRQVLADREYYHRHQRRLDQHLGHLHRAVAVPMLLFEGPPARTARYARWARVYLRRGARLGQGGALLLASSYLPGPLRRAVVSALEVLRTRLPAVAARLPLVPRLGSRANVQREGS